MQISIAGSIQAHFHQPMKPSRLGTEWIVVIQNSSHEHRLMVRTYAQHTALTTNQQHDAVITFVSKYLAEGLLAQKNDQQGVLIIPDEFLTSFSTPLLKKPWWKFW